jgi:hypothetical protein
MIFHGRVAMTKCCVPGRRRFLAGARIQLAENAGRAVTSCCWDELSSWWRKLRTLKSGSKSMRRPRTRIRRPVPLALRRETLRLLHKRRTANVVEIACYAATEASDEEKDGTASLEPGFTVAGGWRISAIAELLSSAGSN